MKKTLLCILSVVAIMFCFAGCQENSDTEQAEQTSSDIQQTTTVMEEIEQTNESTEASETEISEETAEPEESVPYVLDPEIVFTMDCYEDESYINKPMFIAQPEGSDASVYVMLADESKQWEYYEYMFDETFSTTEYVVIEHDGVVDEIPCQWMERFREPFTIYAGDYDGDGETELATARYSVGGTVCAVYELSVFKMIDGHYQCFTADNNKMTDYISYETDDESNAVEFTVKDSDESFTMDIASPENFHGIVYGDVLEYYVYGDRITVEITIFTLEFMPEPWLNLIMNINFSEGKFTCSEPMFEIYE